MGSFPQPSSKIKCVREPNSGFLATQMPIQGAKNEVLTLLSLHLILHGIVGINMKNFLQKKQSRRLSHLRDPVKYELVLRRKE